MKSRINTNVEAKDKGKNQNSMEIEIYLSFQNDSVNIVVSFTI